jgi:hypothetical protein
MTPYICEERGTTPSPVDSHRASSAYSASGSHGGSDALEAIAIVGMSMGFPQGITSHEALWKTMMEKRSTASDFPESRMNINGMYHPDSQRRGQVRSLIAYWLYTRLTCVVVRTIADKG